MSLFELKHISKIYSVGDDKKYALNDISISFPSSGLVAIVGKSGSGKSTLLNMLALIDRPTKGDIFFDGENVQKWGGKKVNEYHNRCMGMVFQHYHLLEEETGLFNVMLPMMVLGKSKKRCTEDAISLCQSIGLPPELYNKKVSDMSGGEKERFALLRGLTNNPFLILADEPTGALDSGNSRAAMELLKRASKTKLVVVVSHNLELVDEYADRVIQISDGKIINDIRKHEFNKGTPRVKEPKSKKATDWIDQISKTNLNKRKKINVFSIISLVLGITSSIVITGFNVNAKKSIDEKKTCHLDYGVSTLSKEIVTERTDGGISIVKTSKPTVEDIESQKQNLSGFFIETNYDFLLPQNSEIFVEGNLINNISLAQIYSFENSYIDKSLILKGKIPNKDSLKYCLINKKAEKVLFPNIKDFLYREIEVKSRKNVYKNINESRVEELIDVDIVFQVAGVVDELDFLSTPKVYFSYLALDDYFSEEIAIKCSEVSGQEMSYKDLVISAKPSEDISCFSYRLFAKDYKTLDYSKIVLNGNLVLTSNATNISLALSNLIDACSVGINLYLALTILGTVLIMGIVTYYSYACDRKKSAILSCLGASQSDISSIYLSESFFLAITSLAGSIPLSIGITALANFIIHSATGFNSLIKIPWFSLYGYTGIFPLILLIGVCLICLCSTLIPIAFSKRISIKEELAEE